MGEALASDGTPPNLISADPVETKSPDRTDASDAVFNAELDRLCRLLRRSFVFDCVTLYLIPGTGLPPQAVFAQAVGRGHQGDNHVSHREVAARRAFESRSPIVHAVRDEFGDERRLRHDYLALPVLVEGEPAGSLVFARFGGPDFSAGQIALAELAAMNVAQSVLLYRWGGSFPGSAGGFRLQQAQEDFIAAVSHELLTPLGFIKGYVTTLLRQDVEWDAATQREFLSIISEETDRLDDLIESLLDSSRLQAGELSLNIETVRLPELLARVADRARRRHAELRLCVQADEGLPPIAADGKRLAQVIHNLIANALKYAPDSDVILAADRQGDWVRIRVQDFGPGVPAEHQPFIFNRFYRAAPAGAQSPGTGLGLYICRQILHAHGGRISVHSESGRGSTFVCELPIGGAVIGEDSGEASGGHDRTDRG